MASISPNAVAKGVTATFTAAVILSVGALIANLVGQRQARRRINPEAVSHG